MKKIPALLSGFLFISLVLPAQEKQPKLLTELAIGPSFPIGKFADKTYSGIDNTPTGMAKTGVSAQLTVGFYVNEVVGLMLSSGYSVYAREASGYENYIRSNLSNNSTVKVNTASWKVGKIMAGCFYITPLTLSSKLTLVTKLAAGVCKTAIPAYHWVAYAQDGAARDQGLQNKTVLPWSFCYQISVTGRYTLNNKLHVLLDINSFNSTAQKVYTYNLNFPPYGPAYSEKRKFRLASVDVLAGIGLSF